MAGWWSSTFSECGDSAWRTRFTLRVSKLGLASKQRGRRVFPRCFPAGASVRMKSMRRALLLITIFLVALITARGVSAAPQHKGSSPLSGVVLSPDDTPLAHASVSYQSSNDSAPHVVRTDSNGHFTISKLKADNYHLRASGKGVFSEWEKNVNLRSGARKELTLRLIYENQIPKAYVESNSKQ